MNLRTLKNGMNLMLSAIILLCVISSSALIVPVNALVGNPQCSGYNDGYNLVSGVVGTVNMQQFEMDVYGTASNWMGLAVVSDTSWTNAAEIGLIGTETWWNWPLPQFTDPYIYVTYWTGSPSNAYS
jgi:hypothetical protein